MANGAGGVIYLTTVDEDNTPPSEKEKQSFRMSLLNFFKAGLSHFNPQSVLLEDFDDRVGDSGILVWMCMLVKMFPTHVFAETTEEKGKTMYRLNEDGEIVLQNVYIPDINQGFVGAGEDQQDTSAVSERNSGSTKHTASQGPASLPKSEADVKDEDIIRMLSENKPDQLSWTSNTTNWRRHLTVGHNGLAENEDQQDTSAVSERNSGSTKHTASQGPASLPKSEADVKDEDIIRMLSENKPDQLSWTSNTTNWRRHLTVGHNGLAENVEK